jgi:hypothetical protein
MFEPRVLQGWPSLEFEQPGTRDAAVNAAQTNEMNPAT